jgi:hypothetical protein
MAFDAKAFADEIAGKLRSSLDARKDAIVAGAGGWPRRAAVKMAWPTLMGELTPITETLVELVSWKFGSLTVDDLLEALADIKHANLAGSAGGDQVPQSRA